MVMHACVRAGLDPVIYSRKEKSQIYAAMFLHKFIPVICPDEPELNIRIFKRGTREGYAEKVYGDPKHPVSWDKFEPGTIKAWNLSSAYDRLWNLYSHRIMDVQIAPLTITMLAQKHDLVFSTIPRPAICYQGHKFRSQNIWVKHGPSSGRLGGQDMMVYNGSDLGDYYRYSEINGYRSWEYSFEPKGELAGCILTKGYKPTETNCVCYPDVVKLGRFGVWEKQILTHHVYEGAFNALQRLRTNHQASSSY
jgi:hypothetical protein